MTADNRVRLDKWLWAARFFKTRSLAADAVSGGKVHVSGNRAKPAHGVKIGEILSIRRRFDEYIVEVRGLSTQRGPASQAIQLYEETLESIQKRETLAALRKLESQGLQRPTQRPTKKDRRRIVRFIHS